MKLSNKPSFVIDEPIETSFDVLDGVKERTRIIPSPTYPYADPMHTDSSTILDIEKPGASTPGQYAIPGRAKEIQDLIEYRGMNFAIGNIFKAAYRIGHCPHSDDLRELRKIMWFAQRELNRLEDKR